MKEFIKDTLVNVHRTATSDEYGQIGRFNFNIRIFGDMKEDVLKYIKTYPIIEVSTYATAGMCVSNILDEGIKKACRIAKSQNENVKYNLNKYDKS